MLDFPLLEALRQECEGMHVVVDVCVDALSKLPLYKRDSSLAYK